ncbi:hypothetical protein ASPCADRAFT_167416 [Aspergillus carbonarius ITEM 5010]|uniref:F-box domain-containing protein n=1 Tax=Aspergillus carbonarius (strain ITEM 5010) TaxID=602072 RepID=A0A1R3RPZ5_ASPC5|nr:hypothetical protein ASPCADRAFT_167416 [Aspergillus carbonarius ITEM 5010]
MLTRLPSELLDAVIGLIASRRDLKRLCEVCTRLHNIAIPHLYRSLVVSAPELSLENLVATLETMPRKYLKYTSEFGFSVPIHERVEARCVHHGANGHFQDDAVQDELADFLLNDESVEYAFMDGEDIDEGMEKGHLVDPFADFSFALGFLKLPDDQLRSFRWEVGTCIPEAIFCGNNSFLGNQSRVQSITLITGGECGANQNAQSLVNLVQFRELQSLDWKGLNRYNDFESIRECISFHGHQIQSLTLDLLSWTRAEKIWADGFRQQSAQLVSVPDNFFSQKVLNIHPGDRKVIFPSLGNLYLSAVSFDYTDMEMAHAFNIEHLKSLKLRNCPGSLDWLRRLLNSGKPMKLKSLELGLDLSSLQKDAYMHITETICHFLHHVPDLRSLYLMLPEPIDWTALTDRLSGHRHLTRVVMHHLVDRGGQNLIDGDIPWPLHLEHILQEKQLTCFGSSIPPRNLASHLRRMQPRPSCKLVHVRTSGVVLDRLINSGQPNWFSESLYTYKYGEDLPYQPEEISDFAQWAFSADGLPNLQVLAWGDFSYGGRYSKFNLLLCRSDDGYQPLTPFNTVSWGVFQDNLDMMAACPLDDILE